MRNTKMIKQTFDYFLDLSTSDEKATIVKIKAGGDYVKARMLAFFSAFKYYKLGSVKVQMVPASTLPVDPTGLSYEAGENTVDPRDMMNPGLVRITNGEDMCPDDANISEDAYKALICDPRWFKFRLNSGFRRKAIPLYWQVGQLHQTQYPGAILNSPFRANDTLLLTSAWQHSKDANISSFNKIADIYSDPRGLFQMGTKGKLGWLPTDFSEVYKFPNSITEQEGGINPVPEVELLTFILPKAYKTKFYYRLYITESVYFKDPVANFTGIDSYYGVKFPLNTIDRAIEPNIVQHYMDGSATSSVNIRSRGNNQGQGELQPDMPNETSEEEQ